MLFRSAAEVQAAIGEILPALLHEPELYIHAAPTHVGAINTLLERKSIAWTKIYSDLGTVLPFNVKLIQVRLPQIDSRNRVSLDMIVGAQEPAAVIDFLKRLQESPLFGPMTLHSTQPPTQNEPLYRYRVSVNYAQKL